MKKIIIQFIALLLLFSGNLINAHAQTPAYKPVFDNFLNGHLSDFAGNVMVQISCKNQVLYTYKAGAYNTNTALEAQSLSKLVTAAVIMTLVEENKFSLNDKAGQYIPSWNANGKQDVTIRQLMAHSSGVVATTDYDGGTNITLAQAVDLIATNTNLLFSPGTNFAYGSSAFKVVSRIAEIVENKPWKQIFSERMATVCGMPNAVYSPNSIDNPLTGQGLICSIDEYANFLKMILNYGMYNSTRVMDSVSIVTIEAQNESFSPFGLGQFREGIVNGVAKELYHPGVSGCFEFINRNKNYYGVIFTQAGLESAGGADFQFRDLIKDNISDTECSTASTCDFNITAASSNGSPVTGSSVTLTANCTGGNCTGLNYSWSGNGISGTNATNTFNAPSTAGSYTYSVTVSKSGCTNKTAIITLPVTASGGSTTCINLGDQGSGNTSELRSYTLNMAGGGNFPLKLTYRSHEGASVARIRINNGSWTNFNLPQTTSTQYVDIALGSYALTSGNNSIDFTSVSGFMNFRQLCAQGSICTPPSAPALSANPASINAGSASALTASGCSGGTILWSDGLGTGSSKSVSPAATKTYTATCSVASCTSSVSSVTVTAIPSACDFNMSVTSSSTNPVTGASVTLTAVCTGANCTGLSYTWSGNGISGTSATKIFNVPATAGNYTYTVTVTKSGCANKTGTITLPVGTSGSSTTCINLGDQGSGNTSEIRSYSLNTTTGGSYPLKLTYRSHESPSVARIRINNGSWTSFNLPQTTVSQYVEIVIGTYLLTSGNNAIDLSSLSGFMNFRQLCAQSGGSPLVLDPTTEIIQQNRLIISPNPNNGIFETSFYLEKGKKAVINIMDLQGRTIYRKSISGQGNHKEKIILTHKASGTLFVQLHKESGVEVKKINIVR